MTLINEVPYYRVLLLHLRVELQRCRTHLDLVEKKTTRFTVVARLHATLRRRLKYQRTQVLLYSVRPLRLLHRRKHKSPTDNTNLYFYVDLVSG